MTLAVRAAESNAFGRHLRRWRKARGKSQLELSMIAGYSQRHLSFVESGRAQPSRSTVMVLCEALAVPLGSRNALLLAAGFAPVYRERAIDGSELAPFRRELEALLERHDPFPALIVDDAWTLVHANTAALRFFNWLRRGQPLQGDNVVQWCFDDNGLKPYMLDWPLAARHLFWRLQREVLADPDNQRLVALLASLHSKLPTESVGGLLDGLRLAPPIMTSAFRRLPEGQAQADSVQAEPEMRFFSLLSTIGTAQDVTLIGLHLETFVPADAETRTQLEWLAAADGARAGG